MKKQIKQLESENDELKNDVFSLKKKLNDIDQIKNLQEDQNKKMKEQIKQLEIDLNLLKDNNIKINITNKNLENENSKQKLLIKQLNEDKKKLQNQINNYEQEQKDLLTSNKSFSIALNSLIGNKDEINLTKSFSDFKNLSKQGNSLASYIIGLFYVKGEVKKKSFPKAITFLKNHFNKEINML